MCLSGICTQLCIPHQTQQQVMTHYSTERAAISMVGVIWLISSPGSQTGASTGVTAIVIRMDGQTVKMSRKWERKLTERHKVSKLVQVIFIPKSAGRPHFMLGSVMADPQQ